MTQIKHHLTDAILMAYAAGALPEAFNLVVSTHVSMCDTCRAQLASFDAVGGEIMMTADDVAMGPDSLASTLAMIDKKPTPPVKTTARRSGVFPAPLQDYVNGDLDAVNWRRIGGGVSQAVLPAAKGATVRLLKIPAGTAVPDHGHRGTELTLVLQGAFKDEVDRFGKGDIEVANEELNHTPVAAKGLDCICLAATDAPLRFNGLIPRIAQMFIRI